MEAFIGLLLTLSLFSIIMYIIIVIVLISTPIIGIWTVIYLVKESKKGQQAGMTPIRTTEPLTKNEIVGDEENPIRTEEEDFLDFDAKFKKL